MWNELRVRTQWCENYETPSQNTESLNPSKTRTVGVTHLVASHTPGSKTFTMKYAKKMPWTCATFMTTVRSRCKTLLCRDVLPWRSTLKLSIATGWRSWYETAALEQYRALLGPYGWEKWLHTPIIEPIVIHWNRNPPLYYYFWLRYYQRC